MPFSTPHNAGRTLPAAAIAALMLLAATPSSAQPDEARAVGREAAAAYNGGDFAEAAALFERQAALDPGDFTAFYNLACARGALGRIEAAEAALTRAVELGFASYTTLLHDPDLEPLRGTDLYASLMRHWPAVMQARRDAALEHASRWMSRKPSITPLDRYRVDVVSAFPDRITAFAVGMLEKVAGWFEAELSPGLFAADHAERDAYAIVMLPEPRDFTRWLVEAFGPGALDSAIGGAYEHDRKRLVTRDLGASLRHEFFHVLHWRHMERFGQLHPIWIQEGLASLVEDMDPGPGGRWTPAPSWRTNIVRNLAELNELTPWSDLAALDQRVFTSSRPLRRYAEARAVFMFLRDRGLLARWYELYTSDPERGYDVDPTGLTAIAAAADAELADLEAEYRAWAASELPDVPQSLDELDVTLGVAFVGGEADGVEVDAISYETRRASDLRLGDVVRSINGRPTTELQELARVLSAFAPGDTVTLAYRRGRLFGETNVPVRADH